MPHLHLPLQSGSDSVLRRMARRCKTEEFASIVHQLRAQIPHFNVTTDIIVGFPGETEQEWQDSVDFIKQIGFGHIHIFTYSKREGTKAATLPNPISSEIKKQRSQQLHVLAEAMKQEFCQANMGRIFPVLWEAYSEPSGEGMQRVFGYTPNYLKVGCTIENNESLTNQIRNAKLIVANENWVFANLME
jgi:threonylcarbamoyladenosine tRNA methylthiotransferase MtaB